MLEHFGLDLPGTWWTILTGVVANCVCAVLGCFLVLRRMSLLGDAVAHAVLPGLAVAFLLTGTLSPGIMLLGGLVAGLLTAMLTQALTNVGNVPEDSSLGVVFTAMFALGVVLIAGLRHTHLDTDCVLFGKFVLVPLETTPILGINIPTALVVLGVILAISVLFVVLFWKELKLSTFDPGLASAMGFSAVAIHYALMALVSGATVASLEAVGAILVVAMLIIPAATAHLLTDRLSRMVLIAVGIGALSAFLGVVIDYPLNTQASGMMVVAASMFFVLALLFSPRYGLVAKGWDRFKLGLRIAAEDVVAMLYRLEERGAKRAATRDDLRNALANRAMTRFAIPLLRRRGMLIAMPDGALQLTDSGRDRARALVRSHRLWEAYLEKHFDLPPDHLHEPAERIEHFIGPDLQDRIAESLSHPGADPHGRNIPEGTTESEDDT